MTANVDSRDLIAALEARFSGALLAPNSTGYDEARRVHNGLVDKRPALIARCRGVSDVVEAVNLGRETALPTAIRGGGHNVAGRATVDGGLLIDLSPMKGIFVDPVARTARAQGGTIWAEFNRDTQVHGLATTGGLVSSTGVAGLTLGGGLGWLMGKYGLAADNLRSVELVTATGEVLNVDATQHPDLFWALRGGGGNFGVAVSFEFQLHAVGPTVIGGLVAHPFERASGMLAFFRDFTARLPDELSMAAGVIHTPDGTKLAAMLACHCGPLGDGEVATRELVGFGPPLMSTIGPMPYVQVNSMLDAGYPRGALNYWKTTFLETLSTEAIQTILDRYAAVPSPMTQIILEHFHGAVTRVPADATAFPHRREGYNMLILGQWIEPNESDRCIAWVRETYKAMQPFRAAGRYMNYFDDDEIDGMAAAYGNNYGRLRDIKTRYDPRNFFHLNQNIAPLG
ncbi:MAG TPA: FAD-binding oxidoreductase [Gemmatimonadaceae bacterium]|nr:FAD-binding oxidoreductase [Gemmatimonadaceae bacterium]